MEACDLHRTVESVFTRSSFNKHVRDFIEVSGSTILIIRQAYDEHGSIGTVRSSTFLFSMKPGELTYTSVQVAVGPHARQRRSPFTC